MTEMNKTNIGKGILFALIVAIVACVIWAVVIGFTGTTTGGFVGGAIAGVLGAVLATVYQKGAGKLNFVGYLVIVILAILAVVGALILGIGMYISNEGHASGIIAGIEFALENRSVRFALIQDAFISGSIAAGMGIATTMSSSKEKKKQEQD